MYVRPGRLPQWQDAVRCLVTQLELPVRLAGLTSLTYQGKSHYLSLSEGSVWLGVQNKASLPKWFKAFPHMNNEGPQWIIMTTSKMTSIKQSDLLSLDVNGISLPASRPELAAYEVLEAIPNHISFEHAAEVFQGLVNLSPRRVESVLKRSHSIQTNRLYLFFAHFYRHPWLTRLDESSVELGSGKRQIVPGGRLDSRYQITVPEKFIDKGATNG